MEKRTAPPKVEQPVQDDTAGKTAEALSKVSDTAMLATHIAAAVEKKMAAEMADHRKLMSSMVEAIKPKPKTITVNVTSFDPEGRPVSYNIEVS